MHSNITAILGGGFAAVVMMAAVAFATQGGPHYDSSGGGGGSFNSSGTMDADTDVTLSGTGNIVLPNGTRIDDTADGKTVITNNAGTQGYGLVSGSSNGRITIQRFDSSPGGEIQLTNLLMNATGFISLPSGSDLTDSADGTFAMTNDAATTGAYLDTNGDGVVSLETSAGSETGSILDVGFIDTRSTTASLRGAGPIYLGNNDGLGCVSTAADASSASSDDGGFYCTTTAGLMAITDGSTGQGELRMKPQYASAEPCGSLDDGTLIWDSTSSHLCVCISSVAEDVRDFTTNCF